jgi:hypothetical protein
MNYKDIILSEFELIKQDLIKRYNEKGMRASGNFESSLEIKEKENGVELWGANYTEQLESGRSSGKFPPIDVIKQWILDKGINFENITLSSLAFLIARKISREGWNRQGYGGIELISEVITPNRIQSIIDKVGALEVSKFIELVRVEFKQFV